MPRQMPARVAEIEEFVALARADGFRAAVVLGMGGSSLAPEVFRRSFGRRAGFPELRVLDSTVPEAVRACAQAAPPATTLYLVASKSGSTIEPSRMLDYFYGAVRAAKGEAAGANFAAVTDPGSPLGAQARRLGFRKVFENFPDIGGRYSALSYFGLVPAALAGVDLRTLLSRAARMAEDCANGSESNPGWALGNALAEHARAGRDKLTLLVSPELASLGLWLEQLVAESTGKEGVGVVPLAQEPPRGADAYGGDRVFVGIELAASQDAALGRRLGELERSGRAVIRLPLRDPLDLGAEFFRWEFATAVLGRALGINPFDQPNVQSAKDRTNALMAELDRTGRLPEPSCGASADGVALAFSEAAGGAGSAATLDEALARFAAAGKPGDYAGLLVYLDPAGAEDAALARLSRALGDASGLAVQPGYGPRYLHSTGQLHKGGANNGLFLIVSRADEPELAIPGHARGFAPLARAQAIGDFQALDAAGRRAAFARVTGDPARALERLARALEAATKPAARA